MTVIPTPDSTVPIVNNAIDFRSTSSIGRTIVFSEGLEGLYASGQSETAAARQLSWLSPLAFTSQAAREAAQVRRVLRGRGDVIPDADTFIAGTVRAESGTLITQDTHFESVPDLDTVVL